MWMSTGWPAIFIYRLLISLSLFVLNVVVVVVESKEKFVYTWAENDVWQKKRKRAKEEISLEKH